MDNGKNTPKICSGSISHAPSAIYLSIDDKRIKKLESALDKMIDKLDSNVELYSDVYLNYARAISSTLDSIEKIKKKGEKHGK